jgi:hypothetical protein
VAAASYKSTEPEDICLGKVIEDVWVDLLSLAITEDTHAESMISKDN